jgi:hypothetical protein
MAALVAAPASAQDRPESPIPFAFTAEPTDCESNRLRLEGYAKHFVNAANGEGRVIIAVSRLGTGEQSRALNRIRLYVVRATLIEELKLREQDVVTAEGPPVNGYGRVEIYMGGRLMDALLVNLGKALCADCCYPDGKRYSYPKQKSKQ